MSVFFVLWPTSKSVVVLSFYKLLLFVCDLFQALHSRRYREVLRTVNFGDDCNSGVCVQFVRMTVSTYAEWNQGSPSDTCILLCCRNVLTNTYYFMHNPDFFCTDNLRMTFSVFTISLTLTRTSLTAVGA